MARSSTGTADELWSSAAERDKYERLAEIFSLVKAIEMLERAYIKDSISSKDYGSACRELISKYKAAQKLVPDFEIKRFIADYKMDCPAAEERLILGRPDMIEADPDPGKGARIVAETVQHFITAMDSLKLNMVAADQLQPLLTDLCESLHKVRALPPDWEHRQKLQNWLQVMAKMKASDELQSEQSRQLLFDLESSYAAFHKLLG